MAYLDGRQLPGQQQYEGNRTDSSDRGAAEQFFRSQGVQSPTDRGLGSLIATCSNAACSSGWLNRLRTRPGPVFEGGSSCSSACTAVRVEAAVRRELEGRLGEPPLRRHRIPLGLVMLEQGWISSEQLRKAIEMQKSGSPGRIGDLLVEQLGVEEKLVTRALSLQWSCPVLALDHHDPEAMARAMPRLFVDAYGALPLRVAGGKILYLGFEERLDPVLALALERMLGLRVETGLVRGSLFRPAEERMLEAVFANTDLVEAASEAPMVRVFAKAIERVKPVESRLVRVHDLLWMRLWRRPYSSPMAEVGSVEDVVCSLASAW